jgi:hypothetical protein
MHQFILIHVSLYKQFEKICSFVTLGLYDKEVNGIYEICKNIMEVLKRFPEEACILISAYVGSYNRMYTCWDKYTTGIETHI